MGGLDIIARNKKGEIKQDYHVSREATSGKNVATDTLKKQEDERRRDKTNTERSEETA